MELFGQKMFISSQRVPLTGTGVLYPRLRDFFVYERTLALDDFTKFKTCFLGHFAPKIIK